MTAEQQARDMLKRMGVDGAQNFSAGELVELANLIAAAQWQPIETAPRDETVILLGYLQHPRMEGSRLVYEGRWHSEQETWTSVNGFIVHPSATHWMPLPAAPHIEAPK